MDRHGNSRAGGNRDQQTFRQWLLEQLKLSRWSVASQETPAIAAKRLGVQEDLLRAAMAERAAGKKLHTSRQLAEQQKLVMNMPVEVGRDWAEYCKLLHVTGGMMLRSILQHFLVHPEITPAMKSPRWFYRKRYYVNKIETRVRAESKISRGAMQALDCRAKELRVRPSRILRGLVIDLLEGRMKQVKLVLAGDMWGDRKRYLHPELFRDAK